MEKMRKLFGSISCSLIFILIGGIIFAGDAVPWRFSSNEKVDYVIVTTKAFAPVFQQLADWKTSKGISTKVVLLENIVQYYSKGDTQFRVREFLKEAVHYWNLKWVLLGGDTAIGNEPLIPARFVESLIAFEPEKNILPSDLYFSDLDGNWDNNGNGKYGEDEDNCDLKPDIFVGRASVNTIEKASVFVQKVINYEKNPPASGIKKALLIGSTMDESTETLEDCKLLAKEYLSGFSIVNRFKTDATPAKIVSDINSFNPHFVFVGAHGMSDYVLVNGSFTNADADKLSNSFPFIYTSISCHTNAFDKDSLSEHFMNNPNGGAVAYWAHSRFGLFDSNNEGYYYSILLIKEFFSLILSNQSNVSPTLGEITARARAKYRDKARGDGICERWLLLGMNLLGDPEMRVWTDDVKELKVGISTPISGDGRISLSVADSQGPVSAAMACARFLDENRVCVTVTAKNHRFKQILVPYEKPFGVYAVGMTDGKGQVHLALQERETVIRGKISDLIQLDTQIRNLETYLKTISKGGKTLEKLTRDYDFLQGLMERSQKEIKAFLLFLIEKKRWSEVENVLDELKKRVIQTPAALRSFKFVLKTISDKFKFDLLQLQKQDSPQARIFQQILDLQSMMEKADGSVQVKGFGKIEVSSEPSGATVYLNNIPQGKTPCLIQDVSFGEHTLKVTLQGHPPISRRVTVNSEKTLHESFSQQANCSIKGTVRFSDKGVAAGVKVELGDRDFSSNKMQWKKYFETVTDAKGCFLFTKLPTKTMYLKVTAQNYECVNKPFNFDQLDQGFNRVVDITIFPNAPIVCQMKNGSGATVRLFKNVYTGFILVDQKGMNREGTAVVKAPLGEFVVFCSKPGYGFKYFFFSNQEGDEGKTRNFKFDCRPVQTVHLVCSGGDKNEYPMTAGASGKYSCKVNLKAQKDPIRFFYEINRNNEQDNGRVLDRKIPVNQDSDGISMNALEVTKTKEFLFEFDSNLEPLYYEKGDDGDNRPNDHFFFTVAKSPEKK